MLLLTATSTPLSVTDARYIYRCLDASSKQASKLATILKATDRFTKSFLSRCSNLAHSLHKKLLRCTTVLGTRNAEFNALLKDAGALSSAFSSKLTFPSKFRPRMAPRSKGVASLFERAKSVKVCIKEFLHVVGEMLAVKTAGPATKEAEPESSFLEEFFTKAENEKGWKIQRAPSPKEREESPYGDESLDPFGVGCRIVEELSLPYDTLLAEEVEVGLVSFSILLLEAYRLPDTVLRECGQMAPLHKVFGTYVILQNATLMGIHRDLMKVIKEGKECVDAERFRHLMPYLSKNYPETTDVLSRTFPSGPTRYARSHYYSPLLPRQLIKTPQFSLGNWSFLADRNKKGPEHPCA
jgi:hypothetical protein